MIDCDVHCAPASWEALAPYLAPSWSHFVEVVRMPLSGGVPPLSGGFSGGAEAYPATAPTSAVQEARVDPGPVVPATYDALKERVLDRSGAGHVIVNCLTMFDATRNPYYQAALAAALNDWLRHDWLDRDDRLRASLVVPWSDPESAVAEIKRMSDDPRFVQVLLPIRADAPWGQKPFHKIHAAAAERGLAVALHAWGLPSHAPTNTGFTTTYMEDYLSNATIVQEHVISFVAEGVFERFPELTVVLVECGFTWQPSLLWRMDKDWKGLWPDTPWVKERPSHYVQRNVRSTTAPAHLGDASAQQLRELVEMVGPHWLLYASDYPHDHGPSGQRLLESVDEDTKEVILHGNAAGLYQLNGSA